MGTYKVVTGANVPVGTLVRGEPCPCDGFQSLKMFQFRNVYGEWVDTVPTLVPLAELEKIENN